MRARVVFPHWHTLKIGFTEFDFQGIFEPAAGLSVMGLPLQ